MLAIAGLLIGIPILSIVAFYLWASSGTLSSSEYEQVMVYAEVEEPEPVPDADTDATFTIVTYNIGYWSGLTNNLAVERSEQLFSDNQKMAIAALIPLEPDILALQEIDFDARRSFYVNQAEALAVPLNMQTGAIAINWDKRYVPFPYWPPAAHFGQIVSGQAVLSRFPVRTHERIVLQRVESKPFFYNALYLDRLAQVVELDVNGQPLVVINVHLEAFDEPTRRQQTEVVQTLLNSYLVNYPVILLGDFNSPPPDPKTPDPTIRILLNNPNIRPAFPRDQLVDGVDGTRVDDTGTERGGAIATFPSDNPIAKLDYIFYTPDRIEALEWRVVTEAQQASDHLPVMLRFRLK